MRILVLGATGRIGSLVIDRAIESGHEVVALSRDPTAIMPRDGLSVTAGDVRKPETLDVAVARVEAVIAALGPRSNAAHEAQPLEEGMRHPGRRRAGARRPAGRPDFVRSAPFVLPR